MCVHDLGRELWWRGPNTWHPKLNEGGSFGSYFILWLIGSQEETAWQKGMAGERCSFHGRQKAENEGRSRGGGAAPSRPCPTNLTLLTRPYLLTAHLAVRLYNPVTFHSPPPWVHEALGILLDINLNGEWASSCWVSVQCSSSNTCGLLEMQNHGHGPWPAELGFAF